MSDQIFEAVIGLEVHAELKTKTKIFCACSTDFGAPPNTQCCPICMGYPGVMPSLNRHAVEQAIRAGLALGCEIQRVSRTDRKQYFYPDLPKAYQISQDEYPLCRNGRLTFSVANGERSVGIRRIHIEEDAGKLIHRDGMTLLDCNRCGVGLIEIVSEPELHTAQEASAYLRALRAILLTVGASDCRMQEGSLRCDVNISLHDPSSQRLGIRTEIKNLNSFAFVEKAIDYEIRRQSALLQSGQPLVSETRRFDPASGKTVLMRIKESAVDYRFLPDPDLLPIVVGEEELEELRATLPELPAPRAARLVRELSLTPYDASVLVSDPRLADFFEQGAARTAYPKLLVNLLLTDLLRDCTSDPFSSPVCAEQLAELADLLGEGTVNSSTAKKLLKRCRQESIELRAVVEREGLAQIRDSAALQTVIGEVLSTSLRAVNDYRNGKTAAIRALQGQAMARTEGRADPVLLERLLLEALSQEPKGD